MQIQSWLNEGQMLHLYNLKCNLFNNKSAAHMIISIQPAKIYTLCSQIILNQFGGENKNFGNISETFFRAVTSKYINRPGVLYKLGNTTESVILYEGKGQR